MISVDKNNEKRKQILKINLYLRGKKSNPWLKLHQGCLEPVSTFCSAWKDNIIYVRLTII